MVQEVKELIGVTDYFVIATASNNRQVEAIIDEVEEKLRIEAGIKPLHRETTSDGSWELLDYGHIVVHVFQPETRDHYRLEALWNDAPVVDLGIRGGHHRFGIQRAHRQAHRSRPRPNSCDLRGGRTAGRLRSDASSVRS